MHCYGQESILSDIKHTRGECKCFTGYYLLTSNMVQVRRWSSECTNIVDPLPSVSVISVVQQNW